MTSKLYLEPSTAGSPSPASHWQSQNWVFPSPTEWQILFRGCPQLLGKAQSYLLPSRISTSRAADHPTVATLAWNPPKPPVGKGSQAWCIPPRYTLQMGGAEHYKTSYWRPPTSGGDVLIPLPPHQRGVFKNLHLHSFKVLFIQLVFRDI